MLVHAHEQVQYVSEIWWFGILKIFFYFKPLSAHGHQVIMVDAVKFVIIVYRTHGKKKQRNLIEINCNIYFLVITVVHVLLQQLVISVNVHIHLLVAIAKD
jgi:hypothetical protein